MKRKIIWWLVALSLIIGTLLLTNNEPVKNIPYLSTVIEMSVGCFIAYRAYKDRILG